MTAADASRWDARYAKHPIATPAPPDALTAAGLGLDDVLGDVPQGAPWRALDVACGAGAQTVWLAEAGAAVLALDASSVAIDLTLAAAHAADVASRVDARVVDLDAGLDASLGEFELIVCQRFRSPALYPQLIERLGPDGVAIVTVLSRCGAASPGEFHAPPGELREVFGSRDDLTVLAESETDGEASIIVTRPPSPTRSFERGR